MDGGLLCVAALGAQHACSAQHRLIRVPHAVRRHIKNPRGKLWLHTLRDKAGAILFLRAINIIAG